jgi:hypothetical protein
VRGCGWPVWWLRHQTLSGTNPPAVETLPLAWLRSRMEGDWLWPSAKVRLTCILRVNHTSTPTFTSTA